MNPFDYSNRGTESSERHHLGSTSTWKESEAGFLCRPNKIF